MESMSSYVPTRNDKIRDITQEIKKKYPQLDDKVRLSIIEKTIDSFGDTGSYSGWIMFYKKEVIAEIVKKIDYEREYETNIKNNSL